MKTQKTILEEFDNKFSAGGLIPCSKTETKLSIVELLTKRYRQFLSTALEEYGEYLTEEAKPKKRREFGAQRDSVEYYGNPQYNEALKDYYQNLIRLNK